MLFRQIQVWNKASLSQNNNQHEQVNGSRRFWKLQIDKIRGEQLDQLFDAILSLKNREECYQFFDDLATMSEIQSFAQRLQVAKMLLNGATYSAIEKETSASTATISRVRRCIDFGSDGYKLVVDRLKEKEDSQS